LLAEEWRQHRDLNDDIYQKYKKNDAKQVFFKTHKSEMCEKYPQFTSNEINKVLEKMFEIIQDSSTTSTQDQAN
jgi:Fe-S-cluster formation regulator IscX/YfhJ